MSLPSESKVASGPDTNAALRLYQRRASHYDAELAMFEPLRRQCIERLKLRPGDCVLDLGCGTGLSLPLLAAKVGPRGRVLGIEQSPDMLGLARQRLAAGQWQQVQLQQSSVDTADLDGVLADAALFHFTHDILQSPQAVARVLAHLRPGARVAACGLQWAPAWIWPANLFALGAAWLSVTSLDGMDRPWWLLAEAMPDFSHRAHWMGAIYSGFGTLPKQRHPSSGYQQ
jgi:SAM-dependent methyltransferase